jgi:hypothetical protein
MFQELVVAGIVTVRRLLSPLNSNPSSFEFTEQDLGFKLEYAPKLPAPLPFMCISQLEKSILSTAPPELYMFNNPIGAN